MCEALDPNPSIGGMGWWHHHHQQQKTPKHCSTWTEMGKYDHRQETLSTTGAWLLKNSHAGNWTESAGDKDSRDDLLVKNEEVFKSAEKQKLYKNLNGRFRLENCIPNTNSLDGLSAVEGYVWTWGDQQRSVHLYWGKKQTKAQRSRSSSFKVVKE